MLPTGSVATCVNYWKNSSRSCGVAPKNFNMPRTGDGNVQRMCGRVSMRS